MGTATTATVIRQNRSRSPLLAERYAWAVVGYNILVIVWGAMVRATGSGAGCGNHWPLCNGQIIPVSPGMHTIIEFTHRSMTGGATFAVLGLLLITFRTTERGAWARWAAVVSGVLLLNEALLGALLVKLGYVTGNQSMGRVVLLSVHLTNTLLLLAGLTVTAVLLPTGIRRQTALVRSRRAPAWLLVAGLIATLLVGVSGSLAALGDTLFPATSLRAAVAQDLAASSHWLLRLRWVHPATAVLAAIFVAMMLQKAWRESGWIGRLSRWLVALLCLQFVLGAADVLLLAPVTMQLLHLLGADLYWVTLVALCTRLLIMDSPGSLQTLGP